MNEEQRKKYNTLKEYVEYYKSIGFTMMAEQFATAVKLIEDLDELVAANGAVKDSTGQ